MTPPNKKLKVGAAFDKNCVKAEDVSIRHLVIDIETTSDTERVPRQALNLALAIDVSTSMHGERMASAKLAASSIVESLNEDDYLSIVSFGEKEKIELNAVKMDRIGKSAAKKTIERLDHRIYTNLSGGWLKAAECVARLMLDKPELHGHIVLLSDGYANRGILSPLVLQEHATQLSTRGVKTSAVGIGDNYSSTLLIKLAEHGGGRMHDAQYPHEIVEVVIGELSQILNTCLSDLTVELNFPIGLNITNLCSFPDNIGSTSLIARLGSIPNKATRRLVLRLEVPPKEKSSNLNISGMISGKDPLTQKVVHTKIETSLKYISGRNSARVSRDKEICKIVAETWQASVIRRASELNRIGDLNELKKYLDHELSRFERYCNGLRDADSLIGELILLRKNADTDWQERLRKEIELSSYQYQTTTSDYRSVNRDKWSQTMDELF